MVPAALRSRSLAFSLPALSSIVSNRAWIKLTSSRLRDIRSLSAPAPESPECTPDA